jgi:hypothetical protein
MIRKMLLESNIYSKAHLELMLEECWRQGKDDLLISKYYPEFHNLKCAKANYYRTKRFKLDITKYLLRNDS